MKAPITSIAKLKYYDDQRIYIMREGIRNHASHELSIEESEKSSILTDKELTSPKMDKISGFHNLTRVGEFVVVGMIKVGVKRLFVTVFNHFMIYCEILNFIRMNMQDR